MKRLRQVVFFGCGIPAGSTPKWSRFYEAELMRCYGTRKIFLVYGSLTADPGAKPLTST